MRGIHLTGIFEELPDYGEHGGSNPEPKEYHLFSVCCVNVYSAMRRTVYEDVL